MGDMTAEMLAEKSESKYNDREIRVLVTGYGPFHVRYPNNSSWSIASTLPQSLPATATCPKVKLIVPKEPIEVAYSSVIGWEKQWMNAELYDIVLHIGLAAGRTFFTLETQSMREPYWQKKDVLGQVFSRKDTERLWPSAKYPDVLRPTFDCQDVWLRWRDHVRDDLDVRPSDDPGNYLCGYIYYMSMAWYWGQEMAERPIMFLHVPDLPSEEEIQGGREVAMGLIRALIESRERKGIVDDLRDSAAARVMEGIRPGDEQDVSKLALPQILGPLGSTDEDMTWTYSR